MLLDQPIREIPGDLPRKWLSDDAIELVVWYLSESEIYGFQIIYDLKDHPKALTFHPERGFTNHLIDSGEHDPHSNQSPVLESTFPYNISEIIALFSDHASELPADIRTFVFTRFSMISNTAEQGAAANP